MTKKNNIKRTLKRILECINATFYFTTLTATNYDFAANQYRKLTRSYTARSGYSAILIQVVCKSHSALDVFNYTFNNGVIEYEVINRTSSAVTGASFVFKILYLKNEIKGGVRHKIVFCHRKVVGTC